MIDFVLGENVAGPAPFWRVAENIGGRHLMPRVLRVECTGKTADREQAILPLVDRRSARRPFQNCIRADEFLRPAWGKVCKAVEHVCLDSVLESHAPIELNMTIDGIAQHAPPSFGQG